MKTRRMAAVLVASALTSVGTARAEPAIGDSAEELFERGKQLVVEKRYDEACQLLARSRQLDPGIGTLLWLGDCYEKSGRLASAWRSFDEAAASAARRRDDRERVARRRAASLEERLTRLVIVVPPASNVDGLEILRDGVRLEASEIGAAQPVDPGTRTIVASAPGRKPWTVTIELPARPDVVSIEVPLLSAESGAQAESAPTPVAPTPAPIALRPVVPVPVEAHSSWMRVSSIALGVLGLGLAGTGTYFGLKAKSTYDDSNAHGHCIDDACDAMGKGLRSDANSSAAMSTIAFGAGASAIAAGVVLFVLAPRSPRASASASRTTTVAPTGGVRDAGLVLTHRW